MSIAVLGAGCFWCVETIFLQLHGVNEIVSGYTGGHTKNPTYKDICSGKTGHVEVCKIVFDTKIITYEDILKLFWEMHDPTTLNKQGADIGTQYRSAIFYTSNKQRDIAIKYRSFEIADKVYKDIYAYRRIFNISNHFYPVIKKLKYK